jgi:outer membrane protein
MKNFFINFFIIFISLTSLSYSSEKIVYLDVDFILANSEKGKIILSNLENKNKENIKILQSKEKILKDEETQIIKQKNIISEDSYKEKVNELKSKIDTFKKDKDELVKNFNQLRQQEINKFIKLVDEILGEYVEKNTIDLVLNKKDILMGKNEYNITNEILELVNKSNK